MGGQEEYQLIHQLFLHDTTVAMILFDPTRGRAALNEVETWNKRLDKQLNGRPAKRLLVGAKREEPSPLVDRQAIDNFCQQHGFAGYIETSARNGRGVPELKEALAEAIAWDELTKTSRPELFQHIRDEIDAMRESGRVVVEMALLDVTIEAKYPDLYEKNAVETVADQLATQGVIARTCLANKAPVLVLRIEEIERYGGSLIVLARNNSQGVPALEVNALRTLQSFPGITKRLSATDEMVVVECVVQILISGGICFEHAGLLVFPSCFKTSGGVSPIALEDAVSLYYDFSGAIDNIYASLVATLGQSGVFGPVRLWEDRAEFEAAGQGACGLAKKARGAGFAHLDLYFDGDVPEKRRAEFIEFVEQHLKQHGLEVVDKIAIVCPCGYEFDQETIQWRIANGYSDVQCRCERRHSLVRSAEASRERDPELTQRVYALRGRAEKKRKEEGEKVTRALHAAPAAVSDAPLRILHLSDLHFTESAAPMTKVRWLLDDLKKKRWDTLAGKSAIDALDYLVISGDFTDRGDEGGFYRAYDFLMRLTLDFDLSAERCILVPGAQDIVDDDAFRLTRKRPADGDFVDGGRGMFAVRDPETYGNRFEAFSRHLYHPFLKKPYPLSADGQGVAQLYAETGVQFVSLNSCCRIDQYRPTDSGINMDAVAKAIADADRQLKERTAPTLRIGVWHHAVAGPGLMSDLTFLEHLRDNGVRLALTGAIREMRREIVGHWHGERLHVVGAGSFGSPAGGLPESTPRLYNLLEIERDLRKVRVHTRCQRQSDGTWDGWHEWDNPAGAGRLAYYDLNL